MTEDTIFDMASLTKLLATATAVMQLYEQGKVQFDDPVQQYRRTSTRRTIRRGDGVVRVGVAVVSGRSWRAARAVAGGDGAGVGA
jgi:D-alanyl-D-alanine carboxypeptidase